MTTLEERVQALENNRCYDDTDLKEKMGYDDIPEGSSIQAEIDALKQNTTSSPLNEERVLAIEQRTYDDSDIKEKIGYDDIPEGKTLIGQINELKLMVGM